MKAKHLYFLKLQNCRVSSVFKDTTNNSIREWLSDSRPLFFVCTGMKLQKFCPGRKFTCMVIEHAILSVILLAF